MGGMSDSAFQTVRLRRGAHSAAERGACVVELASMLAGEPFSDRPRSVCPVIAGFLRAYNDLLPEEELEELYPYAALVVGSASSFSARCRRTVRLREWAGMRTPGRPPWRFAPVTPRDQTSLAAARAAVRLPSEGRGAAVAELLGELVSIGRRAPGDRVALELVPMTAPARAAGQHMRRDRSPEPPAQPHRGVDVADRAVQWTVAGVASAHPAAATYREN
jgi:hypothetical protein